MVEWLLYVYLAGGNVPINNPSAKPYPTQAQCEAVARVVERGAAAMHKDYKAACKNE